MMRNYQLYLKDILIAMQNVEEFVESMTYEEFIKDDKTTSAVIKKIRNYR